MMRGLMIAGLAVCLGGASTGCSEDETVPATTSNTIGGGGTTATGTGGTAGTGGTGATGGGGSASYEGWSRRFGDAEGQVGRAVSIDSQGDVLLACQFENSIDFGGGVLVAAPDILDGVLAKLHGADGSHQWSLQLHAAGENAAIADVAVGPDDEVFIGGRFGEGITLDGTAWTALGVDDGFVAKISSSGTVLWSRQLASPGTATVRQLAVDGAGRVVVGGNFSDTVDLGGSTLDSAGDADSDGFVAVFDPDGNAVWGRAFGGTWSVDAVHGVGVDGQGNVWVTGFFGHTAVDFGGGPIEASGSKDIFLAKYDGDGGYLTANVFPWEQGSGLVENFRLAVRPSGEPVLVGNFASSVTFDQTLTAAGNVNDIFLAWFDAQGVPTWSERYGDDSPQSQSAIALGPTDELSVLGGTMGLVDFGGGPLGGSLDNNFMARLTPDGTHVHSQLVPAGIPVGLAVFSDHDWLFTGSVSDPSVDVGHGPLVGDDGDVIVVRLGPAGEP